MALINKIIEQEVLSLTVQDRIELIDRLIESLNIPGNPDVEDLWAEEGEKRFSDLESGSSTLIPGSRVFSNIKSVFLQ
jgi:putative addiction module component (TIGR02574 family)